MEETSRKLDVNSTSEIGDGDRILHHQVSVDWRGRPCRANTHGGMTAAVFVLGLSRSLSCSFKDYTLCLVYAKLRFS